MNLLTDRLIRTRLIRWRNRDTVFTRSVRDYGTGPCSGLPRAPASPTSRMACIFSTIGNNRHAPVGHKRAATDISRMAGFATQL